jgi:hypothetical protein
VGALIQAENSTEPEQLARVIANLVIWLQALRVRDWTKQWKDEGIGQGESTVRKRLLAKRFWQLNRLTTAPREELETWAERIFDATMLEKFFNKRDGRR